MFKHTNKILLMALMCHATNIQAQTNVLPGDVDGDGVLTKADVTLLSQKLTGKANSIQNPTAADFNKDGNVNIVDLTLLINALLHPITGECNGYKWVDLGLSVKWATCNVGATSPAEYGDYYSWGETYTKSSYSWANYLAKEGGKMSDWNDCGTNKDPLKYYVYPNEASIAGSQYDVARAKWGGTWRLPTVEEQNEIRKNCYWLWTDNYNGSKKSGYIVYKAKAEADKGLYSYSYNTPSATYSLDDTHIFLTAAGYRSENTLYSTGDVGRYWSANPTAGSAPDVSTLSFDPSLILRLSFFRNDGFSVRAVIK